MAHNTHSPRKRFWALAALAGIVGGGALLAVAELLALVIARDGSPVLAVGSFVIDIVPRPLKELAIEQFGEYDKIVLLGSIGLAVVIAAALAGLLQYLRPPLGLVLFGLAGALAVAAIVTRAAATPFASVPTIVGTIVAGVVLHLLVVRLRRWRDAAVAAHGVATVIDGPARASATSAAATAGPTAASATPAAVSGPASASAAPAVTPRSIAAASSR